jgi:hypothetical protein
LTVRNNGKYSKTPVQNKNKYGKSPVSDAECVFLASVYFVLHLIPYKIRSISIKLA